MKSAAEHNFGVAWGQLLRRLSLERESTIVHLCTFREWRFHPVRMWRFDFAWPDQKVALEIDGLGKQRLSNALKAGTFKPASRAAAQAAALGGHRTVDGMRKDHEKQNEAAILGWRVMRVLSADKLRAHEWAAMVLRALEST